jgi:hypothetical protein
VSDVVDGRIRTLTLIVQNVHTIGDRANKVVIDAMEGIIGDDKHGGRARRLRLVSPTVRVVRVLAQTVYRSHDVNPQLLPAISLHMPPAT